MQSIVILAWHHVTLCYVMSFQTLCSASAKSKLHSQHPISDLYISDLQSRPFGVAILVAGWEAGHGPGAGPVLFYADPSGMFTKYEAKAIGSGSEGAQTTLQEAYRADLTFAEAELLALSTLKQVMEEKVRQVIFMGLQSQ